MTRDTDGRDPDNNFLGREPYVDMETVARFLGVSRRTVQRLVAESDLFPAYRLRRRIRFRLSEVERWVRTNRSRGR